MTLGVVELHPANAQQSAKAIVKRKLERAHGIFSLTDLKAAAFWTSACVPTR